MTMGAPTERSVALINGPNLNLLGTREPEVYGSATLQDIESELAAYAQQSGITIHPFQSNIEGAIIDAIQEAAQRDRGIIINPGGYSHTSVAIRDAVAACQIPVIEVHLSNLWKREEFRHTSLISPVCVGVISGLGKGGYRLALDGLMDIWASEEG